MGRNYGWSEGGAEGWSSMGGISVVSSGRAVSIGWFPLPLPPHFPTFWVKHPLPSKSPLLSP